MLRRRRGMLRLDLCSISSLAEQHSATIRSGLAAAAALLLGALIGLPVASEPELIHPILTFVRAEPCSLLLVFPVRDTFAREVTLRVGMAGPP